MSKKKHPVYICQSCGLESLRWFGRCPQCQSWETLQESTRAPDKKRSGAKAGITSLASQDSQATRPRPSGFNELDRVLGGGLFPGAVVLIGGAPGIGKSTLLLQVSALARQTGVKTLYVSGEESSGQIRQRAERLNLDPKMIDICSETDTEALTNLFQDKSYQAVTVDSIQTLQHPAIPQGPGSVIQLRESVQALVQSAKQNDITLILVGHLTKEGSIAGPRTVEHLVDSVLYFESDSQGDLRILRPQKNRFGAVEEIGIFRLTAKGFEEVPNPSLSFLPHGLSTPPGSAIFAGLEGSRVLLSEVQSLVHPCGYGTAARSASGFERNRLNLLSAVLTTRLALKLAEKDIYLNVTGGLQLREPAADLAVVASILSAAENKAPPEKSVFFGEVGLSGEVRAVRQPWLRLREAEKLGFKRCFYPAGSGKPERAFNIEATAIQSLRQLKANICKN